MPKRILSIFGLILVFLSGCQQRAVKEKFHNQDVVLLPKEITGIWKAEGYPWRIVLSQDGKVSSATLPFGEVEVKPNQQTVVEMKDGSKSVYTAGDFEVDYQPSTKELSITIEVKSIHIVFLDEVIDGNSTDIFTGAVFDDGKIWDTTWYSLVDYGPRFPQEPNAIGEALRFYKEQNESDQR